MAGGRRGGGGGNNNSFYGRDQDGRDSRDSGRGNNDRSSNDNDRSSSDNGRSSGGSQDSRQSSQDNDDRSDRRDSRDDTTKRSDGKRSVDSDRGGQDNSRPPATLVEAWGRLLKSSGPPQSAADGATKPAPGKEEPKDNRHHGAGAPRHRQPQTTTRAPATPTGPTAATPARRPVVIGELPPIGTKPYTSHQVLAVNLGPDAMAAVQQSGFTVHRSASITTLGALVTTLTVPPGMDAVEARALLQSALPAEKFALNRVYRFYHTAQQGSVDRAERTTTARSGSGVSCLGDQCAGRQIIQWKEHLRTCSQGLRIGIIDTAVDHLHPAFATNRLSLGTFLPEGRAPAPSWHGTGVLALLAGNPNSGTPGLVPSGEFYVANVFFADGNGDLATDTISLLRALDWMAAFDVKVINMSFSGPKDPLIQTAIGKLGAKGVVMVAAAGNDGPTAPPVYPAAYREVVAVTAVSKDLRSYAYANRGNHIDVAAPGVGIWTAVPGAREGYRTGTSFAAPFVTAILATVVGKAGKREKNDLLTELATVDLGTPGRDPVYGRGLLVAPDGCSPAAVAKAPSAPADNVLPVSSATWAPVTTTIAPAASTPALGFR